MIDADFPINKVSEAYEFLINATPRPLMVILNYEREYSIKEDITYVNTNRINHLENHLVKVAIVGTGSFATGMHLPNLQKLKDKYQIHAVCSRTPSKAHSVAIQFNAKYSTSDFNRILDDAEVDLVMICTRHDSHAELVLKSLKAGKNVFVEKPLAVTKEQLDEIRDFYKNTEYNKPSLFVGFNRRFSKYLLEIERVVKDRISPLFISYRMNAGYVNSDSWIHEDGGRIIGEACHIIDLMNFLTKSKIISFCSESIGNSESKYSPNDNKSFILKYEDGSVCTINYFACGNKGLGKEYMEVHFDGKSIILDDYKSLQAYGIKVNAIKSSTSQKGQLEELEVMYDYMIGSSKSLPIELSDIFLTTEVSFLLA
jgi:predicted dehydrogenase